MKKNAKRFIAGLVVAIVLILGGVQSAKAWQWGDVEGGVNPTEQPTQTPTPTP